MSQSVLLALVAALSCLVYDPNATAAEPKRALLLLGAIVSVAGTFLRAADAKMHFGAVHAWFAAFLALSALSTLWGLPSGYADLGTWLGAAAIGVAASRTRRPRLVWHWASVLVAVVISAWMLTAFAIGKRGFGLHAGQGNPNWTGLLLAVLLPALLDAATATERRLRALSLVAVACSIPALFLSHSRVGWIAAATAVLVTVVACAVTRSRATMTALVPLLVGSLLVVPVARLDRAAAQKAPPVAQPVDGADHASDHSSEAPPLRSVAGRVWIWRSSIDALQLPAGVGLGGFGHSYLDAQGKRLAVLAPRSASRHFVNATTAHQEFLQVAVESGPLAALVLAVSIIVAMREFFRARDAAGVATVVAFAVAMMGDSPLRQPGPCVVLALALATLPGSRVWEPTRWTSWASRAALLPLAALLMFATQSWLSTRALTESERAAPDKRGLLLSRAAAIAPNSGEVQLSRGLFALSVGQWDESFRYLTKSDTLLANVGTRIAIGELRLAENSSGASEAYLAALAWNPGSLRAHMGLAESYRRTRKLAAAEEHAKIARLLAPGDPRVVELSEAIARDRIDAE